MKPLILDSALGTELENRGEYLPSFKTSIWSAYSLIHNPEIIKQIHIDNIEAGADVITTSNYHATPELLKKLQIIYETNNCNWWWWIWQRDWRT